jgi:hypothetical protein
MNRWADESEEHLEPPPAENGGSGVRPRLQLKPRSSKAAPQDSGSSGGGSSSIFGAAKPREAVLASKGIDPTLVDKRVERKASVTRLTGAFCKFLALVWFGSHTANLYSLHALA